jgi:hypothetical protein
MGTNDGALGAGSQRPIVVLPATCIGHPMAAKRISCPNEGTVTLTTVIAAEDGSPQPVIVTVCPSHVRPARHWLEGLGVGDPIDTWSTRSFAEIIGTIEESGISWSVLKSA